MPEKSTHPEFTGATDEDVPPPAPGEAAPEEEPDAEPTDSREWPAFSATEPNGPTQAEGDEDGEAAEWRQRMKDAGMPPRFQEAHFTRNCKWMRDAEGKQAALALAGEISSPGEDGSFFIERGGRRYHSLLLSGDFGTGKTWLASATFKRILYLHQQRNPREASAMWRRFLTFVGTVQSTYGGAAQETSEDVIQRYSASDLLLLDELGDLQKDAETHDRRELITRVLNHRNDHFRTTLITTNLDAEGLADQFGQRAFERIKEMAVFVRMKGANLRDNPPPSAPISQ